MGEVIPLAPHQYPYIGLRYRYNRGKQMNKQEVITGLNSLRFEAEKENDEHKAEIIAEATRMLIFSSLDWK